jgi:GNAT superfamily N-acetyltransferase
MICAERERKLSEKEIPRFEGESWVNGVRQMAHELLLGTRMSVMETESNVLRIELSDGTPCSIRQMTEGDEPAFRGFHAVIPEEEQLFIKSKIRDGSLFEEWMSDPNGEEHIALLAFVDGNLVAIGSLHQRLGGWKRHIGKVYFLTHPDYRGLGLLDALLERLIEMSGELGLTKLESELNGERTVAIESLGAMGFRELVRIPDYIRDMKAESHDYVLMGMDLVADFENLGAGD